MASPSSRPQLRFIYLDCEDAAKWAGHEQIAFALLHEGAAWQHFRCHNGELPPLEGLAQRCDGVLISGSHYSISEGLPWMRRLEDWLRQAAAQGVRLLGMCFGAQALAQALGGAVGKNPDGGFVLRVEDVQLLEPLRRCAALKLAQADAAPSNGSSGSSDAAAAGAAAGAAAAQPAVSCVRLIQSHGDQVLQLPEGAIPLARSSSAPYEIWTLPAGNVLAVQGHAELTREETLEKIWPAIVAAGRLSPEEAAESRRSLAEDPTDAELVKALYRRFFECGLPEAAAACAADGARPQAAAQRVAGS